MPKFFRILFLVLLAGVSTLAHTAELFVLDERLERQDLAPYLVALEDSAGTLTIEEARRQFAAGAFGPADPKIGWRIQA